jgi:hypothetical protein
MCNILRRVMHVISMDQHVTRSNITPAAQRNARREAAASPLRDLFDRTSVLVVSPDVLERDACSSLQLGFRIMRSSQ